MVNIRTLAADKAEAADMAHIDKKITALRMRQPARIVLTNTGSQLLAEHRQILVGFPPVEQTVIRQQTKALAAELAAELRADELAGLKADVDAARSKPKPAPTRLRVAKGAPASTVRKARARQLKPSRQLSVAEQRLLIAQMRAGRVQGVPKGRGTLAQMRAVVASGLRPSGDLTKPRFHRHGTKGYHFS